MVSKSSTKAKIVPFVSVIIPCYNDERGIQTTLQSLSKQDYPRERWEVIVVDNNSTDNTARVAQSFANLLPALKIVKETKQSSYAARNTGIRTAKGEIFAFVDSDMSVKNDWISKAVTNILNERADYVGCRVDIYTQHCPPTIWEIYNQRTGFSIRTYMEDTGYTVGANLVVRRRVFTAVGLFDERLISSGDLEFGNRVRDAGFKLFYDDQNPMRHPARDSMRSFWNKYFRIGKGHVDLSYFYPNRYGKLKFKPVLGLLSPIGIVRYILGISNMNFRHKWQMLLPEIFVRFAQACGRIVRYAEIKLAIYQ